MTAEGASDSLSQVADEVTSCTLCPLHLSRLHAVPGEGKPDAAVMLIGEAPGRNEDLQGRPFVGAAGKKLESLILEAGLRREDVFITNVVKCRPPENRKPTASESEACKPYLERQMSIISPRVLVLLGDTALKRFLPEESLGRAHGKIFSHGALEIFVTFHPAAMIYNHGLEDVMREDFRALGSALAARG